MFLDFSYIIHKVNCVTGWTFQISKQHKKNQICFFSGIASAHNELVCSTWGNFHFLTFDGDAFQLPSTCNHILTSQCGGSYEDFNVQMRREIVNGEPTISKITLKLDGTVVELTKGSISVNGQTWATPAQANALAATAELMLLDYNYS